MEADGSTDEDHPPHARRDDRMDDHEDPRLNEPGTQGMPGSLLDSEHNLPGQQGAPPSPPDRTAK